MAFDVPETIAFIDGMKRPDSEYVGNRFTLAGLPTREKKQVAMQQAYVQACLKEIQG